MTSTQPGALEPGARRVLVTGSSDGIGAGIARALEAAGHRVVRHARSETRAAAVRAQLAPGAEIVVGDLASLAETGGLAAQIAAAGPFDAVVHNAGWAPPGPDRPLTADGIEATFAINALSLYVLLASTPLPPRIVVVSSDSITRATLDPDNVQHQRDWNLELAYPDAKLAGTAIAFALARRRPDIVVTAVHPGWVRTKMSAGSAAPLSIAEGADTPAWLAVSPDPEAGVSGGFYTGRVQVRLNPQCWDEDLQERLLAVCKNLTGIAFPSFPSPAGRAGGQPPRMR